MARAAAPPAGAHLSPALLGLLAALVVLWGLNWPMMKLALMEVPPWTFRVICLGVGGLGLLAVTRLGGDSIAVPPGRWRPLVVIALINVTVWHLASAYALLYIDSGRAAIIAYTMPVWASILAVYVLGERLERRRVAGLALGMVALALLVGPDIGGFGEAPLGTLAMLGAALSWAVGTVALKRHEWGMPVTALTGWMLLVGGIPVVPGWLLLEGWPADLAGISPTAALATLYAATVAMIFCYCNYVRLVTILPASVAATSTLGIPVVGVVSGALILGEPVGLAEAAALVLVLGALGLVLLPRGGRARP